MRIAFLGTGEFGAPALHALIAAGHEITTCVSQPDRPAGRGRKLVPSHIHAVADTLGLPHLQAIDVNAMPPEKVLAGAELAFVAAFGQKISPALLSAAPRGFVNLHASLLPKFRGAAPFQWAILSGERDTGVTIFQLDADWDAGPLLGQAATTIGELETADELHDRLAQLGSRLTLDVIARIAADHAAPLPQNPADASRAPKLRKHDGWIDWTQGAFMVQRRIHGLWSWPAATCSLLLPGREPLQVQLARAARVADTYLTARIGELQPDGVVRCGDGAIQVLEIKPAGGRCMPFHDFANGRQFQAPAKLVSSQREASS